MAVAAGEEEDVVLAFDNAASISDALLVIGVAISLIDACGALVIAGRPDM